MKLAVTAEELVGLQKGNTIYYSADTIWWTHDKDDLCKPTQDHLDKMAAQFGQAAVDSFMENPFPLDAFNSPLYITENAPAWMDHKRTVSHEAYGPDVSKRMEVFMWSHAKNMALIMDHILERAKTDKNVLCKFQNFYLLLEDVVFNKQEQETENADDSN